MPIHREFTASCDKCGKKFEGSSDSSSDLKDKMRKAGWRTGNTYFCADCESICIHCGNKKAPHVMKGDT